MQRTPGGAVRGDCLTGLIFCRQQGSLCEGSCMLCGSRWVHLTLQGPFDQVRVSLCRR